MPTTNPDNIFFPDNSTTWATVSDFSVAASSTQAAFLNRQRYSYRWNTASDRSAETAMRQGDFGYQLDTRTEYIYDSGAWRVGVPYATFNIASKTIATTAYQGSGAVSIDASNSTSSTFSTGGSFFIVVSDAGVYLLNYYATCSAATSGFGMIGIAPDATTNFASQIGRAQFVGDNAASVSTSYYHSAGGAFYFYWKQPDSTSRSYAATVTITRLG